MQHEMALIVMSHGAFAQGAMHSAEMILGAQTNYRIVALSHQQGREDVYHALEEAAAQLDTSRGLLLLVDICGGTPANAAGEMVLTREGVHAFCGFNLPVLIECLSNRHEDIAVIEESVRECFGVSFCNLGRLLKGGVQDGH